MQTSKLTASGLEHEFSYSNVRIMFYSLQNTCTKCVRVVQAVVTSRPKLDSTQSKLISLSHNSPRQLFRSIQQDWCASVHASASSSHYTGRAAERLTARGEPTGEAWAACRWGFRLRLHRCSVPGTTLCSPRREAGCAWALWSWAFPLPTQGPAEDTRTGSCVQTTTILRGVWSLPTSLWEGRAAPSQRLLFEE